MKIKIYSLLLLAILLNSCSDYFDVSPKTNIKAEDLFQNETGFNDALLGVYTIMSTKNLYGENMTYGFMDVLAQYYPGIKSNTNHIFINDVAYDYTNLAVSNRIGTIWDKHYSAIANTNAILKYIDNNPAIFSGGSHDVFKGEAMALRAYLHFNLLRTFANAPVLGMEEKAIPYVDVYSKEAQPALTVSEVLDKIIADLEAAHELMKESDPYGPNFASIPVLSTPKVLTNRQYRMNYYAVTAALAIVNQYAGNNEDALLYAQEIIGTADGTTKAPISLFKFANLSTDVTAASEIIFKLNVSKLVTYTDTYLSFAASQGLRNTWLGINTAIINQMYATTGGTSIDVRPSVFFGASINGESAVAKYTNKTDVPMLKISELYLVAAQLETDLNNALAYFNKFTASRGIAAKSGLTREELDAEIDNEFKKEFIGEGKLFWNYKRKNATTIGSANDVTVTNSAIYTLPIPADEYEFGNL